MRGLCRGEARPRWAQGQWPHCRVALSGSRPRGHHGLPSCPGQVPTRRRLQGRRLSRAGTAGAGTQVESPDSDVGKGDPEASEGPGRGPSTRSRGQEAKQGEGARPLRAQLQGSRASGATPGTMLVATHPRLPARPRPRDSPTQAGVCPPIQQASEETMRSVSRGAALLPARVRGLRGQRARPRWTGPEGEPATLSRETNASAFVLDCSAPPPHSQEAPEESQIASAKCPLSTARGAPLAFLLLNRRVHFWRHDVHSEAQAYARAA